MRTNFYDIESLRNVFTLANFRPEDNEVDIYFLVDDPALVSAPDFVRQASLRILKVNENFRGPINFFDLKQERNARHLASQFGLCDARLINDPDSPSTYDSFDPSFRITCDTDPNYDPSLHPYFLGYNSYNYDTTMLAQFLFEVFPNHPYFDAASVIRPSVSFRPTTASYMRTQNNYLFSSTFKANMPDFLGRTLDGNGRWTKMDWSDPRVRIRKNMLMSGRHLDVARLNESQSHVGLKRLIGMLGGQILESSKLRPGQDVIEDADQFYDLLAYNVSDCVNLKLYVFDHPFYQGKFSLKKGLLETYPELVYNKLPDKYAPDVRPQTTRRDRLFIDSSSAQLATKSLCPYGHLTDMPVVSFMYPSERKAKELGMPRVNVLEETKKFFHSKFPQPELRAEFDRIYAYYKRLEGRNFNTSKNYAEDYEYEADRGEYGPNGKYPLARYEGENVADYSKADTCLLYYNKDGSPSSCFVTFSIGGIHGAEYNRALFEHRVAEYKLKEYMLDQVKGLYPDPRDLKKARHVDVTMPDGTVVTCTAGTFLKSGSTLKSAEYKEHLVKEPMLFVPNKKTGTTVLHKDYVFTSADPTNHEDFKSYYPNMLRMMSAFYNEGLGYDRYAEIFDNKENYGFLMKEKNANLSPENAEKYRHLREMTNLPLDPLVISDAERALYANQREGTKLVLNSASGAADATFESNIRMNNTIIAMRVIGQLFSYRIGQAQTFEGAKITSTNTDGLFSVMEPALNNAILARESADIGVEIEPEPTFLISKDTNNRLEIDMDTDEIQAASGGTLACRRWAKKGPDPSKSLAHPAIIDWALAEYLLRAGKTQTDKITLASDFDMDIGREILAQAVKIFKPDRMLNLFQNVIASSPGSISYVFATNPKSPSIPVPMQHYNRVFIMKDGTPGAVHIHQASAKVVTDAMAKTRAKTQAPPIQHDPTALSVLLTNGVDIQDIPAGREATIKKFSGIDENWFMLVLNKDLSRLPQADIDFLLDNLDFEKYLTLLRDAFLNSWWNDVPQDAGQDPGQAQGQAPAVVAPSAPADVGALNATGPDEDGVENRKPDLKAGFDIRAALYLATTSPNIKTPRNAFVLFSQPLAQADADVLVRCLKEAAAGLSEPVPFRDHIRRFTEMLVQVRPGLRVEIQESLDANTYESVPTLVI